MYIIFAYVYILYKINVSYSLFEFLGILSFDII